MSRLSLLSLCLLPFACQTDAMVEAPAFDPDLAEGHLASEHEEVAPGVYVLTATLNSGAIRYVSPHEAARRHAMGRDGTDPREPLDETCYNYDDQNYQDGLSGSTMFGGNPTWYGVANAWSFHYDALGTANDQDYEQVQAYLWSYSPNAVSYISATGYVYVNGAYVGYVTANERGMTTALAYAIFDATCEDGTVSVEVLTYHSWNDYGPRDQSLYLSNVSRASVECCED